MQSIELNQALHGYRDGHRALGSSIELGTKDAKTLLVLSDISGPGSRLESSGYLSGYPLAQSGLYALARTWPAPEMPRPGCVWTHTLLIDFADLAILNDLSQLVYLFRRPENSVSKEYKSTIVFDESTERSFLNEEAVAIAVPLMMALYGFPSKPVISFEGDREMSENSVLALWAQQWPRLRRSFRFCTLATSDRSTKNSPFDLQLLPESMPSLKSRFVDAIDANRHDSDPDWLNIAIDDLNSPQPQALRQFLFQAGSDLQNGRGNFVNLCRIFRTLEGVDSTQPDLKTALELIPDRSDINSACALKSIVLRRLLTKKSRLTRPVLSFMVDHLALLDHNDLNDDATDFGISLMKTQPKLFLKMGQNGEVGESILQRTLENAPIKDILAAANESTDILTIALKSRSELLETPEAWSLIDENDSGALDQILKANISPVVLVAALASARFELAEPILQRVDLSVLMDALHRAFSQNSLTSDSLCSWLGAISTASAISDLFASIEGVDRRFLHIVSELYDPDALPSRTKTDPWLQAITDSTNTLPDDDELSLRSYILTRGLCDHVQNAGELARFGFEATDRALVTNRLPYPQWSQLERRLPRSIFSSEWDKCRRLRKGVMGYCVDDSWPAEVFINLANDDELFAVLVSIANDSYRGRQYLKAVKEFLKGSSDQIAHKRRAIIKHILKGY